MVSDGRSGGVGGSDRGVERMNPSVEGARKGAWMCKVDYAAYVSEIMPPAGKMRDGEIGVTFAEMGLLSPEMVILGLTNAD